MALQDIDARVKKSGDTMTGNLQGKYFQGTWLQTTAASDLGSSPPKIAVINNDGWIYYRTPSELAKDIGLTNSNYVRSFYETNEYFDSFTSNNLVGINYCGAGTGGEFYIGREWGKNSDGNNFGMQLRFSGWNGQLYTRSFNGWGAQWSDWLTYLNNTNFGNYALPLTGGTLTGQLKFTNSNGIVVRHIDGESTTFGGDLYLNYGVSAPIHFGSGGNYCITSDGLYYTGNCRCLSGYGDNSPALRWHALEFVSNGMTIGTNNGQCQPGSGNTSGVWYYPPEGTYSTSTAANLQVIRLTWQPNVWVNELFFSPNTNKFYHRSVQNGTALNWGQIWEAGDAVTGAVWNDYAECREADTIEPGYVLVETGDDSLTKSTKRLSPFAGVSSDTWGFSQGETDKAKTPIAVAGRVLVYPWQDRNNYKPGDCVCTAPEGKVDIMTREEIIQYPDRIVGTVSSVPAYDKWGGGENADREPVDVNGRIWIKVR